MFIKSLVYQLLSQICLITSQYTFCFWHSIVLKDGTFVQHGQTLLKCGNNKENRVSNSTVYIVEGNESESTS